MFAVVISLNQNLYVDKSDLGVFERMSLIVGKSINFFDSDI